MNQLPLSAPCQYNFREERIANFLGLVVVEAARIMAPTIAGAEVISDRVVHAALAFWAWRLMARSCPIVRTFSPSASRIRLGISMGYICGHVRNLPGGLSRSFLIHLYTLRLEQYSAILYRIQGLLECDLDYEVFASVNVLSFHAVPLLPLVPNCVNTFRINNFRLCLTCPHGCAH